MSDIFLSYATKDRLRIRLLVEALESRGWSVWWDRTIPPGKTFDIVIEEALDKARCAIVLWSDASVASDWVKTEAAEAARRGILVPVLIDDVRVPFEFRRIQAARLVGWNGDPTEREFVQLLHALTAIMADPSTERRPLEAPRPPPASATPPAPSAAGPAMPRSSAILRRRGSKFTVSIGILAVALLIGGTYLRRWAQLQRPIVVGVMEIRARGNTPTWMCDFTRDALNTVLSKIDNVHVFSQQKIDLVRRKHHLTGIEAAEKLGIAKMISGTMSTGDQNLILNVEVVDIVSGLLEAKRDLWGSEAQLVAMQNRAVEEIVNALKVEVSADKLKAIFASRTNDQLEGYKLLTETMGGFVDVQEKSKSPPSQPKTPATSWIAPWPASAHAEDNSEQAAVQHLLERYRTALEAKNLDQLAAIHIAMSEGMREALTRYFAAADGLKIQFSNFDILVEGDEAVATFTRNDDFKDSRSGREMHLEIRVSSLIAKQEGTWKIRGLKKPS